tara:strand:+ start:240 stop:440 length:201 start_codon:yes stop_codon:yes gene_type:complete
MKIYVLVLSMWGLTAEGQWTYIGNQNVLKQDLTFEECQKLADKSSWEKHHKNDYYDIQLDCYEKKL